jgi:hypothetical protein
MNFNADGYEPFFLADAYCRNMLRLALPELEPLSSSQIENYMAYRQFWSFHFTPTSTKGGS